MFSISHDHRWAMVGGSAGGLNPTYQRGGGAGFRVSDPGAEKKAEGRGPGRGIFNLQQNNRKKFSQTNTLLYE